MLQKQTKISQDLSISSTQRIQALSKQTIESPSPTFPSIENDNNNNQSNGQDTSRGEKTLANSQKELIKLGGIITDASFKELFDTFFVLRHKQIFLLRSEIRNEQTFRYHPLSAVANINRVHELRDRCYRLQMILFEIPRGNKFNLLI